MGHHCSLTWTLLCMIRWKHQSSPQALCFRETNGVSQAPRGKVHLSTSTFDPQAWASYRINSSDLEIIFACRQSELWKLPAKYCCAYINSTKFSLLNTKLRSFICIWEEDIKRVSFKQYVVHQKAQRQKSYNNGNNKVPKQNSQVLQESILFHGKETEMCFKIKF